MAETFAQLFEESIQKTTFTPGAIVTARVVRVDNDYVVVDAGLKSEGYIPINEFKDRSGELSVTAGDEIEVAIESIEDGFGEPELSHERAKKMKQWRELEAAHIAGDMITGVINNKVKGGYTVEIGNIRAFLPGSLVDVRPVRDMTFLEGKELEFKIIKMDQKRNNIVVSRRAVVQAGSSADREALLENLQEGQEVKGIVKNLTDYGAFIDLGGIDGLLHITDISWKRVKHPNEILTVGEEIPVKILRFDRDKNRVSLGIKQLGDDPWSDITRRYPEGSRLVGKITNITDYGCFVEIEAGVEGLVHMSEMDWTNKNIHPSKVVSLGDEVEVKVLEIDEDRRRISLGMKQCKANPWETFSATHNKGDLIKGSIRSITDFGIFIGMDGGIDGLVHLSDIDWDLPGEEAVKKYSKGQELEAVILAIDPDRERISLGIKQLNSDPFTQYVELNGKGSIVKGKVVEVDAKAAQVELADQVVAELRAGDISGEKKVDDARTELKVGDEVEVKIVALDKRNRSIGVSIKAKDAHDEKAALESYKAENQSGSTTTLGDLLKEKMDTTDETEN